MTATVPRKGRLKSPDARRRQTQIRLRDDEREEINRAAALDALEPTTWMRAVLLREARRVIYDK